MINKNDIKILKFLRKNKTGWFTTDKIWRRIGERKASYSTIASRLKYLREKDLILFQKHKDNFKKVNHFENIYKYKTDALDELIVDDTTAI